MRKVAPRSKGLTAKTQLRFRPKQREALALLAAFKDTSSNSEIVEAIDAHIAHHAAEIAEARKRKLKK